MKTFKVLDFWNVCTFNDHHNFQRVVELNHACVGIFDVLSECDFLSEDKILRVLAVIDDMSVLVIDGNVENLFQEMNNLRIGFYNCFCLEKLYTLETKREAMEIDTLDGKKLENFDSVKWFQDKNWFK